MLKKPLSFGAEGVGLCRTERMFNAADRIGLFQEHDSSRHTEERVEALRHLLPLQEKDFEDILRAMTGNPVTIRLLDPPLHEFLPSEEDIQREIAKLEKCQEALGNVCNIPELLRDIDPSLEHVLSEDEHMLKNLAELQSSQLNKKMATLQKIRTLREVNPMLGHRGVTLRHNFPRNLRDANRSNSDCDWTINQGRCACKGGNYDSAGLHKPRTQPRLRHDTTS